ncbi:hypothetical protein [Marinifilum caeruleilacunae]
MKTLTKNSARKRMSSRAVRHT